MNFETLRAARGLKSRRGEQGRLRNLVNFLLPLNPSHPTLTRIDGETIGFCALIGSIVVILMVLLTFLH
ncbi:MAG: hypothetical protein K1X83_00165 [Oligoflexia bacterium]|nr:hypothetical protein [Oligoflexia bacterium]